jgi:hypothetical protein
MQCVVDPYREVKGDKKMNFTLGITIWLVVGFIAGIIKILDKNFDKIHQEAIEKTGLGNPSNPKLFSLVMSTIFGFYSMYVELRYNFSKKK